MTSILHEYPNSYIGKTVCYTRNNDFKSNRLSCDSMSKNEKCKSTWYLILSNYTDKCRLCGKVRTFSINLYIWQEERYYIRI